MKYVSTGDATNANIRFLAADVFAANLSLRTGREELQVSFFIGHQPLLLAYVNTDSMPTFVPWTMYTMCVHGSNLSPVVQWSSGPVAVDVVSSC